MISVQIDIEIWYNVGMSYIDTLSDMKKKIDALELEVKRLHDTMKFLADNETEQILYIFKYLKTLNNEINHIYDVIGPIEEKIFPDVREARRKLWSIMEEMEKRSDHPRDGKKGGFDGPDIYPR